MKYINCKAIAQEILDEVKSVDTPKGLLIIAVGHNPASESYIKGKVKDCEYCGIPCHIARPTTQDALYETIMTANMDKSIGGIIVQLPLPEGWDEDYYTALVSRDKDVDGFRYDSAFAPCTPEGIMHILHKEVGDLVGKDVLVIGRGKLVGEPIVKMLVNEDCTVTIAHSKTIGLRHYIQEAEIIISATGRFGLVDLLDCEDSIVVIDAGVTRNNEGKLVGDCYNFTEECYNLKVTPVPGGVGLLTRAMLMKHMMEVNK